MPTSVSPSASDRTIPPTMRRGKQRSSLGQAIESAFLAGLFSNAAARRFATVSSLAMAVGGLRHVTKENILDHPLRHALLDTVTSHPGIHLRELAQRHNTAVTNTQWHLRKLELAGLLKTEKAHGKRLYYPVQGGLASRHKAVQNAARANGNADQLLQFIAAQPGIHPAKMANSLSMNPGTVRWHLRRLEQAGLVRIIPDGALMHYYSVLRHGRPMMENHAIPAAAEGRQPSAPVGR